jgi:protein-arginine kinase activator protein McsA
MSKSLKQKAKFGKDIFKTLADAFRENYDLWNSLQFEEWVRLEDAEQESEKIRMEYECLISKAEKNCADCYQELKQKLKLVLNVLGHADYSEARKVVKELLKEKGAK